MYTREFYEKLHAQSIHTPLMILSLVLPLLPKRPKRVLDVGCGVGAWCHCAARLGATNVVGIDGPWCPRELLFDGAWTFVETDLEHAPLPAGPFDLAICLELAEHLPTQRGPSLVAELCASAPAVLWSAATPGQGGDSHINERPHAYWCALFAEHGYTTTDLVRPAIASDLRTPKWYRDNVLLMLKTDESASS